MNILEVKRQIKAACEAYLAKDELGLPKIPLHMQRPLIIIGPPGIGKTAIAAQVADELNINFVAYSITHHTRQSALGLPYIDSAEFDGKSERVSRYTMSEIIAAVHDSIQSSNTSAGILFLDEINCASETLAPAMLQFLQYKTFGQHALPREWIIVCAANPPEYNRAAREFDPAMLDRLKVLNVEPDVEVWLSYADDASIHPAIVSYVAAHPEHFYKVRTSSVRPQIVTARGWEDLSKLVYVYEDLGYPVDTQVCIQYIQDVAIAQDIASHIELYHSYHTNFDFPAIAEGSLDEKTRHSYVEQLVKASSDVHFMLASEIFSLIAKEVENYHIHNQAIELIAARKGEANLATTLQQEIYQLLDAHAKRSELKVRKVALSLLEDDDSQKRDYAAALDRLLAFADEVLEQSAALTMLVAHLAQNASIMDFAATHNISHLEKLVRATDLHARRLAILDRVDTTTHALKN